MGEERLPVWLYLSADRQLQGPRDPSQSAIERPETQPADQGAGHQVHVDPADPLSGEASPVDQRDGVFVRHDRRHGELREESQDLVAVPQRAQADRSIVSTHLSVVQDTSADLTSADRVVRSHCVHGPIICAGYTIISP